MQTAPFSDDRQTGVMMAMVVIIFTASTMMLVVLLSAVTSTAQFANQTVYRQVAQKAAQAALEEGKDNFDGNQRFDELDIDEDGVVDNDDNLNGIADTLEEKQLFINDTYRVTYQLSVNDTGVLDGGRSKKVTGTGRVYMPAGASTARYTRSMYGEIIRSTITDNTPSDYAPLAWYDASCSPPSTELGCEFPTVLRSGTADVAANPISLREENSANGHHCGGEPRTSSPSDRQLSLTKGGECGSSTAQKVGLLFNAGGGLGDGATIESAYMQFRSSAKLNTNVTLRIRGIKVPNQANFTTANSSQLSSATTASVNWSISSNWNNGESHHNKQRTPNLKDIVQEVINQPGWTTGNNIGLIIECVSGSCGGHRKVHASPITLNMVYSGYTAAGTNDSVEVWRDRSGNGHHLSALSSSARPVLSTVSQTPLSSDPNGKPMVNFRLGDAMSGTVPLSTGRISNGYTVIAALQFMNQTDSTDGNGYFISFRGPGTKSGSEPESTVSPFWRHPYAGFHSNDLEMGSTADYICASDSPWWPPYERQCRWYNLIAGDSKWTITSVRSQITSLEALFRRSGSNMGPQTYGYDQAKLYAPYTIAFNYNPRNSVRQSSFQVSEVIIYDHDLTCPQIESVEHYLAQKWGYSDSRLNNWSRYDSQGCSENNIPAF